MDPGPLRDVLTAFLGVATGVLSGLFGVGGAIISTPGIRALGASALISVGTTLPSIIPGALSGTLRYTRERLIDWRVVGATAPLGVLAAVGGARLAPSVPGDGHLLMLMTAAILLFSAWRMLRPQPAQDAADAIIPDPNPSRARGIAPFAAIGTVAGFVSGLLGIGGGVLMVPAFVEIGKLKLKTAIATSLACVGIFAIPGTITHAIERNIDWRFALLLTVGVIPGARLGAILAIRANDQRLKRIVGLFLMGIAVLYATGELIALRS